MPDVATGLLDTCMEGKGYGKSRTVDRTDAGGTTHGQAVRLVAHLARLSER
jgi:hypothetical protein